MTSSQQGVDKFFRRQVFDVIDPVNLKGKSRKNRLLVHTNGDWHMAATAFVVRDSSDVGLEVLVQTRSNFVDIACGASDQSVATQLLVQDGEDTEVAIRRGLSEELGIEHDELKQLVMWNEMGSAYVVKKYADDPTLWNREIVVNYVATLAEGTDMQTNFKVAGYEWLPWEVFVNLVRSHPSTFTKTARMYCANNRLVSELSNAFSTVLDNKEVVRFNSSLLYASFAENDYLVRKHGETMCKIEVYETKYQLAKVAESEFETDNWIKMIVRDDLESFLRKHK